MKRIVFLCFLVLLSIGGFASENKSSLDVAIDMCYIDPFKDNVVYNELTLGLNIDEDLSLRIPINLVIPTTSNIDLVGLGGSIDVLYRPLFNGIFISFSLVKIQYLFGYDAPLDNIQYLNKVSFGYTFNVFDSWFIEPSILFFNLNGMYEDSLLLLRESFNGFPSVRGSLLVGYKLCEI